MLDLQSHEQDFLAYVRPFEAAAKAAPLRLKVEHTFKVLEHTQKLIHSPQSDVQGRQPLAMSDAELARAALLAALYHDVGRFEQFARYATFHDAKSVNHARLGLAMLKQQAFLARESPRVRALTQGAVLLHNRYLLPGHAHADLLHITHMVRDADKLDILRIMTLHLSQALPENDAVFLHVTDDPAMWTPKVLEDVLQGRVARYGDLRYVNDFRLLLCTWWHELHFESTRQSLRQSGLLQQVVDGLPAALEPHKHFLRNMLA